MSAPLQLRFGLKHSLASYVTEIAVGRQELASAYRLVYDRYVQRGFIPPSPGEIVYHDTFGLPQSRTIRTTYRGRTVGTVTVVGDNFHGLQLESTYPLEVSQLRRENRSLAEVTCLAIEGRSEERHRGAFFALTRFMYQYARWCHYDDLLLAVHPRHAKFYERWFRVYRLGPCRPYQLVQGQPAIACRIDLHCVNHVVASDVSHWYNAPRIAPAEFQQPGISPVDHAYFVSRAEPSHAPLLHRAA